MHAVFVSGEESLQLTSSHLRRIALHGTSGLLLILVLIWGPLSIQVG